MRVPVFLCLLLSSLASGFCQSVRDPSLIGHWAFDEPSGTVAVDETGSFPGTIHNAAHVAGRVGGALEFNGADSYVYVGGEGTPLQLVRTNYTIAWWLKSGGTTGWHEDIICMDDGADYSGGWQIYLPFGGPQMNLVHSDGISGESGVWGGVATVESVWRHYAVTFDGSNRKFYIDGVLVGTRSTPRGIVTDGDDPLVFGAMRLQSGAIVNFFKGTLDEIHIYNRPLTADEISVLGPGKDTNAPVVTISSPAAGPVLGSPLRFEGNITDDRAVQSARWQRNGIEMGQVSLNAGHFSFDAPILTGETHLKIIATDAAGNEGSSEVVVTLAPTNQSNDDLWDVSHGVVVTQESAVFTESGGPGFLGGGGSTNDLGSTVFQDGFTNGYIHWAEWKTLDAVTISTVRLFAQGNTNGGREMGRFTLKAKSPGSSTFDITVFSFVPTHPYFQLDPSSGLILETNLPVLTAQEFRGEFEQANLSTDGSDGPRILELDAFGPSSSGAPKIVNQPSSKEALAGSTVTFAVGATGDAPLQYQWVHASTNLIDSTHFNGAQTWQLTVSNLALDDAGDYSVIVSNSLDHATSQSVDLAVIIDTNAPVVQITSPAAGVQSSQSFTLEGQITEPYGLASVSWEQNGRTQGTLPVSGGRFSLPGQSFDFGENHIKVIASDVSGNVGSSEVIANWTLPRLLTLTGSPAQQEGGRISIPVTLSSTGGVSGATMVISFQTGILTDPQFEWSSALADGFVSVNPGIGSVKCSFALPGLELPAGSVDIGTISFRTRSVPGTTSTPISLALQDISSANGDEYTTDNYVRGTTATVTKRKIVGDNNANDRLDVGDASVILGFIAGFDAPRSWDVQGNDLNKSLTLDSGDVIRVLRAVVGLDPQPQAPMAQLRQGVLVSGAGALPSSSIELVSDKSTALAGDKITVEAQLKEQTLPISAVSFSLEYPTNALRLENATSQTVGPIVPSGSVSMWNVSPAQNNYTLQDGAVSVAISSASAWPTNNGVVGRFTFTVQPTATTRYTWPIQLKNLEVSRDGYQDESLGGAAMNFVARAPVSATFTPAITFSGSGAAQLVLQGDLGATYVVEASGDLKNWVQVGTYSTTTSGTVTIQDPDASASTRFYRATLVQ